MPNQPPVVSIASPSDGVSFHAGAEIAFTGSVTDAEDDDAILTDGLAWTSSIDGTIGSGGNVIAILSSGTHLITASATDSDGASHSATVTLTVSNGIETAMVPAGGITYAHTRGRLRARDLRITILVTNDSNEPVADASVSIALKRNGVLDSTGTGRTGAGGTLTFTKRRPRIGCYTTEVTMLMADGHNWDGFTPANSSC